MSRTSGTEGFDTAKLCFAENLTFTSPATEPEKFNLYKGLYQLALGLEQMQAEINDLNREVALLRQGR